MARLTKFCIVLGVLLGLLVLKVHWQYEYPGWSETVNITGSVISFERSQDMILVARGKDSSTDVFKAMGWSHAHDRYVQMCLIRLASQGLLTKYLPYNKVLFKTDLKSQQMKLLDHSLDSLPHVHPDHMKLLTAYVDGINSYFQSHPRPLEFILFNYEPANFTAVDVLTIQNFIAYAGLNDICLIVEKLVLELFRETSHADILQMAFGPHLDHATDELIEIYKTIRDMRPLGDQNTAHVPKLTNSNNWAISGKLSESGFPIMGSDPHMDISQLPNLFYESHYIGEDGYKSIGISAAGTPGNIMGRNNHLAYSLTYGMLDMSDYFIENVENMQYERDGKFYALQERVVQIAEKDCYFYETNDGHTIERSLESVHEPIGTGRYLAAKYALSTEADVAALHIYFSAVSAKSVFDVKDKIAINVLGSNFVLADSSGNIAYQQVYHL